MDEQHSIREVLGTCDVHDGDAAAVQTVTFGAEGRAFECRLCDDHLAEFRKAMAAWTAHARASRAPETTRTGPRSRLAKRRRYAEPTSRARPTPVQERARQRFERMLDVAAELIEERGIEGTTTTMIAERAGTSIGSIYNFAGDKYAIARALSARYVAEVGSGFEKLAGDAGNQRALAAALVDLVAGMYDRHGALGPLLGSRGASDDLRLAREALHEGLVELIERLITLRGRSADPARRRRVADMCARILWSVVGEVVRRPQEDREIGLIELQVTLTTYLSVGLGGASDAPLISRAS